jgi:hypothetical protein
MEHQKLWIRWRHITMPPSHERIDTGSRRRTHRWARRGARRWSWRRHRRRSHGYGGEATIKWATATAEQHSAHGQAPHRTWRRRRGWKRHPIGEAAGTPLQAPRRGAEAPARSSRSRSSHRGLDRLGNARRRWRWTAAKPTNRHGQMEELDEAEQIPTWRRRSSLELARIERRSRRRFAFAREKSIRVRASEWESEGGGRLGQAGPV